MVYSNERRFGFGKTHLAAEGVTAANKSSALKVPKSSSIIVQFIWIWGESVKLCTNVSGSLRSRAPHHLQVTLPVSNNLVGRRG